jgi:Fibronectin type III domain
VRSTSPIRRAVGVAATGMLGMTAAAVVVAGAAQAAPPAPPAFSVTGSGTTAPVPPGICWIEWTVSGGAGGAASVAAGGAAGARGGTLTVTLPAYEGDSYEIFPGGAGNTGIDGARAVGGASASPFPGTSGQEGSLDGSGSGGAASRVTLPGNDLLVEAFGGRGGGPTGGAGGGLDGTNHALNAEPGSFDPTGTGTGTAGSIMGTGIPCAPEPPVLQSVAGGDGRLTLSIPEIHGRVPVAGYEYTVDGGATWRPLTGVVSAMRQKSATITGLVNGTPYTVRVRALPAAGVPSSPSNALTTTPTAPPAAPAAPAAEPPSGGLPVPPTVPASDGKLGSSGATATAMDRGERITLSGAGYAPNSTVTVIVYSVPHVLTTVVTDAFGAFTVEVVLPERLPTGRHTLVASGVDPLGNARTMTLPVTVKGGAIGQGGLAYTGADIALPTIGGVAALVLGSGLLVAGRRRTIA